jgi:hypothetical protein
MRLGNKYVDVEGPTEIKCVVGNTRETTPSSPIRTESVKVGFHRVPCRRTVSKHEGHVRTGEATHQGTQLRSIMHKVYPPHQRQIRPHQLHGILKCSRRPLIITLRTLFKRH